MYKGFWEQSREKRPEESAAGRVESRAPAETKRVSNERRKVREKTTSDRLKLDLVRRALVYRESAMAVVVSHVKSDLHEHANWCLKNRTSTLLAPLT